MRDAIDAMRRAFSALSSGTAAVPIRTVIPVPDVDGVALFMPARAAASGLGIKAVTVYPHNAERGLPRIHAAMLVMDAATGAPVALLEGGALTAIRTGAASGLATDLLARAEAASLLVIGAGVQARTQLEAVCAVRDIRTVSIVSQRRSRAETFATEARARLGGRCQVAVARSVAEAAPGADVICVATSSPAPVLMDADVRPGTHINAIGSFTPEMCEVDPVLLGRACVVVDHRPAALAEAGEVIAAIGMGALREVDLVELGELVGDGEGRNRPRRESDGTRTVTVFKSVGVAVQDVVAGAWACEAAERMDLGVVVEL
jgi:ornithine cyclodeaminase